MQMVDWCVLGQVGGLDGKDGGWWVAGGWVGRQVGVLGGVLSGVQSGVDSRVGWITG